MIFLEYRSILSSINSQYLNSLDNVRISHLCKVTFRITGTVPITTNRDFAIIIGDGSISYGSATFLHVGDNLMGRGLTTGTGTDRVFEKTLILVRA